MLLHKPILLKEVIKALKIKKNGLYIDGTFGCGGHSKKILKNINNKGFLYAFDQDPISKIYAAKIKNKRFKLINKKFSKIKKFCENKKILGKIDGILLDLGISLNQLNDKKRGFTFKKNIPLDMRINQKKKKPINKIINKMNEKKINKILKKYGNVKHSKKISKFIFINKQEKKIITTYDLIRIIKKITPKKKNSDFLKKIFLAFRIYINKEDKELKKILNKISTILKSKGRLIVITFNSLENKIIKNFLKIEKDKYLKSIKNTYKKQKKIRILKKIKPNIHEKCYNSHSRNAVLRIIEIY